jgi:acyl-CoA synthetase (NDP forming)
MIEESGRRGARAAVVLAAGFAETGSEGAEQERAIAATAREQGLTLIGPNCMGLMSNESRLHATGFAAMHPPAGRLSFVSQSGSIGPTVVNSCERRGIGVDKFVSVGNEAQVSAFDVLDHLRDDPNTECVMMYLEGIDDGRHFMEAARRATHVKPVVVLRGGITESGARRRRRTLGLWPDRPRCSGPRHGRRGSSWPVPPRSWGTSGPAWPTSRSPADAGWRWSRTAEARASWPRMPWPLTAWSWPTCPAT